MAVHACLKKEFTEDEKYHNLPRWLINYGIVTTVRMKHWSQTTCLAAINGSYIICASLWHTYLNTILVCETNLLQNYKNLVFTVNSNNICLYLSNKKNLMQTRGGVHETLYPQHMLAPNNNIEMIPNLQQEIFNGICSNINQVLYSSSPISWPSFKPLAQIVFEISCWQVKNPQICKGP